MDWIDLAQDKDEWKALVNTVMNFWVPWNTGKFLNCCTTGGFSRRAQFHEVSYYETHRQSAEQRWRGSARRRAATYTAKNKQKKRRQISMSQVGFETTIPVFEREKVFRALDRAANISRVPRNNEIMIYYWIWITHLPTWTIFYSLSWIPAPISPEDSSISFPEICLPGTVRTELQNMISLAQGIQALSASEFSLF
jgi:hypothetical protein